MSKDDDRKDMDLRPVTTPRKREKAADIIDETAAKIDDPLAVLEVLKSAILKQDVDPEKAKQAVSQVLQNYEAQNRIFLIAAANAQLPRIVRLLSFITATEKELFKDDRIANMDSKTLLRLYALAQTNTVVGIDDIKKVADMRLEHLRATQGRDGLEGVFEDATRDEEALRLSKLPGLEPSERNRVRGLLQGLQESIENDASVTEFEDDDPNSDD